MAKNSGCFQCHRGLPGGRDRPAHFRQAHRQKAPGDRKPYPRGQKPPHGTHGRIPKGRKDQKGLCSVRT